MVAEVSLMELPSDECHYTLLMISHILMIDIISIFDENADISLGV